MLEGLGRIVAESLPKHEYHGLCILVEAVVQSAIPDLHRRHPGNAIHEGRGLCGSMLHEDKGISPADIKSGKAYLNNIEQLTPNSLLSLYLRLRAKQLEAADARARR